MLRHFLSSPSSPPGPPRLFLYAEAAVLLILGISLLSSYMERYPLSKQADGKYYQISDTDQSPASTDRKNQNTNETKNDIKWVDFTVTCEAMTKAYRLDVDTFQSEPHLNWIELLAYLGARYGGDFSRYKAADLDSLAQKLKDGSTMEELTKDMKYYAYYLEAYQAVLNGMVGPYQAEIPVKTPSDSSQDSSTNETLETTWVEAYGLKAFSPIAKGFPYSEFDDFGAARSYGYKRQHLGHDMMGQVGTPIFTGKDIRFMSLHLIPKLFCRYLKEYLHLIPCHYYLFDQQR